MRNLNRWVATRRAPIRWIVIRRIATLWMARLTWLLDPVCYFTVTGFAQDGPWAEIGVDYNYVRANAAPRGGLRMPVHAWR